MDGGVEAALELPNVDANVAVALIASRAAPEAELLIRNDLADVLIRILLFLRRSLVETVAVQVRLHVMIEARRLRLAVEVLHLRNVAVAHPRMVNAVLVVILLQINVDVLILHQRNPSPLPALGLLHPFVRLLPWKPMATPRMMLEHPKEKSPARETRSNLPPIRDLPAEAVLAPIAQDLEAEAAHLVHAVHHLDPTAINLMKSMTNMNHFCKSW